jgi:hypothetical protein
LPTYLISCILTQRGASEMLTTTDRQIARELRRRLEVIAPLLDLRVFGSRARGDAA